MFTSSRLVSLVIALLLAVSACGKKAEALAPAAAPAFAPEAERSAVKATGKKVALILGNKEYADPSQNLKNSTNDAVLIEKTLLGLGFEVVGGAKQGLNLTAEKMEAQLHAFEQRSKGAQVALVFFAGHGLVSRTKSDHYLIASDYAFKDAQTVHLKSLAVSRIMETFNAIQADYQMLFIDACRTLVRGTDSFDARGIRPLSDAENLKIFYSTSAADVSSDGSGASNSPFTAALVQHMTRPGLEYSYFERAVVKQVMLDTQSTSGKQVPKPYGTFLNDFYFVPQAAPAPGPSPAVSATANPTPTLAKLAPTPQQTFPFRDKQIFKDCPDCPNMVVIPQDGFRMGSRPDEPGRRKGKDDHEGDGTRWVTFSERFAMGQTEVTVAQFRRFVQAKGGYQTDAEKNLGTGAGCYAYDQSDNKWDWRAGRSWRNPGWSIKDNEPVVCVSHNDANAYTTWLSEQTGKRYQLPSEAQWEFSARAGTTTRFYWGDDPTGVQSCTYANRAAKANKSPWGSNWGKSEDGFDATPCDDKHWYVAPVGSYKPNDWGLYDTAGNALEWTADCYEGNYAKVKGDGRAHQGADAKCQARVLRGGSWNNNARNLRVADRNGDAPGNRGISFGFRLTRMLP